MPTGPTGVTGWELNESREYSKNESATLLFGIFNTDSESLAQDQLQAMAPLYFNGLQRARTTVSPADIDGDNSSWRGTATYSLFRPPLEVGQSQFSFDTGGGSVHITQSIDTVHNYGPDAQDFEGAIGVSKDQVAGTDIIEATYNFSEVHIKEDGDITVTYKEILFDLTSKTNDASFKGTSAGECLFLGAQGTKRSDDEWDITYNFAARKNKTGMVVGTLSGISKEGWEYLWVEYGPKVVGGQNLQVPKAAHVEQVYYEADFSTLDIGV